ncbi:50S ribosomal protein L25 [Candidatus Viridilinea mediisalina]|uniref:Large ribosomal subunit protein bL25 n=1 Tax=Candidatus Viridilinea mediisalina TaxID=2024553 RepID=A0A2A6RFY6_9CHLR|nr:50S ribosomal protein L25 [Candidatus Viridilinea mediisalina]PDW01853.1 50S ribosomal protein L25 [Candidatus Viridilinea mediisalina]
MATIQTLEAQTRTVTGKKVKHLRTQSLIPATVYGKGFEPQNIQVRDRAFQLLYRQTGKTALINLVIDGTPSAVFVQAVQRHPLKRDIIHIDFKVVNLKIAVHVEVPVVAVGESPLVARGDALINHALGIVMVEALPAELPQHIEVDISPLTSIEKSIHVRDIPPSNSYKILTDPNTVLISLTQIRAITVDDSILDNATPAEPELIRRPRADDEA